MRTFFALQNQYWLITPSRRVSHELVSLCLGSWADYWGKPWSDSPHQHWDQVLLLPSQAIGKTLAWLKMQHVPWRCFSSCPSWTVLTALCVAFQLISIVTRTNSQNHITTVLWSLHWLPVSKGIEYKIICFTYHCVHKTAPQYLHELVSQSSPPRSFRPSFLCRQNLFRFDENTNTRHSETR